MDRQKYYKERIKAIPTTQVLPNFLSKISKSQSKKVNNFMTEDQTEEEYNSLYDKVKIITVPEVIS